VSDNFLFVIEVVGVLRAVVGYGGGCRAADFKMEGKMAYVRILDASRRTS
jgi:hypothetical protein